MSKVIKENKCTCQSCGNVWHYGKSEQFKNFSTALDNFGKEASCCACCGGRALINKKDVVDLSKCPKCGSRAITKEVVTHTV